MPAEMHDRASRPRFDQGPHGERGRPRPQPLSVSRGGSFRDRARRPNAAAGAAGVHSLRGKPENMKPANFKLKDPPERTIVRLGLDSIRDLMGSAGVLARSR